MVFLSPDVCVLRPSPGRFNGCEKAFGHKWRLSRLYMNRSMSTSMYSYNNLKRGVHHQGVNDCCRTFVAVLLLQVQSLRWNPPYTLLPAFRSMITSPIPVEVSFD